jgi:hypothetical protein
LAEKYQGSRNYRPVEDKELGSCEARHGVLVDTPFTVFALKEQKYVLMMMSTYGTMERKGKETRRAIMVDGKLTTTKFQYPEVVANHYQFRHVVDDHNSRRHAPISLEETWATSAWPHRVLAFLLAITEVNMGLWVRYEDKKKATTTTKDHSVLTFRKTLAFALIYNKYYDFQADTEAKRSSMRLAATAEHFLLTMPVGYKMQHDGKMVECKTRYHQMKCSTKGCQTRVRTYCQCSRGVYRCAECYAIHIAEVKIDPPLSALD